MNMVGRIYTLGYAAYGAEQELEQLMARKPEMLLLDVRLHPWSRWQPQFCKEALLERYGQHRYKHDRRLGNVNYQDLTKPVRLAGPCLDMAIDLPVTYLLYGYDVVLLCACAEYSRCHRKLVAEMIADRLAEMVGSGVLS
jgi:uncharacterized protein (DUF488 family)